MAVLHLTHRYFACLGQQADSTRHLIAGPSGAQSSLPLQAHGIWDGGYFVPEPSASDALLSDYFRPADDLPLKPCCEVRLSVVSA
jgi:hypothetical protein